MSTNIPTFLTDENTILLGAAAIEAWEAQSARCNCGSCGDAEHAVSGTAGDMPAKWLGCYNCRATCGAPLIYRTHSQVDRAREKIKQARPEVIAEKQARDEKAKKLRVTQLERGWDGCQFVGVEEGRKRAIKLS